MAPDRFDDETRRTLREIAKDYKVFTSNVTRIIGRMRIILACIFVVLFAGAALSVYLIDQNSNRSEENTEALRQIQEERYDNVFSACVDQNVRHDQTITELDKLLIKRITGRTVDPRTPSREVPRLLKRAIRKVTPRVRIQIIEGRFSTVLLINALAPRKTSCVEYARARVDPRRRILNPTQRNRK